MLKTYFPENKCTIDLKPKPIKRVLSHEFKQYNDNFDPTMSSSPPNEFMEKLTKRYQQLTLID